MRKQSGAEHASAFTLKPAGRRSTSDRWLGLALALPALALFVLVMGYPLASSLATAFFERSLLRPDAIFVGLDNIVSVFTGELLSLTRNTILFSVGATALPMLIALVVALTLSSGIRGQRTFRSVLLVPWVLPSVVVSFIWLWIFNPNYGILNGALRSIGLIEQNRYWLSDGATAMAAIVVANTWITFPWMMVMLLAGLQTVPTDLLGAAAVDGASYWQRLRFVILPHLRGIIGIILLLSTLWNFQHFDLIYVMTQGGPGGATRTFSVGLYQTAFQGFDLGRGAAIGFFWFLIVGVIGWLYFRIERNEK